MVPAPSKNDSTKSSAALVARERQGDNAAPLSITEISNLLKRAVEDRFGYVRLRGELSGVKRAASGHLYCSLKDEKSVIDAVMWRGNASRISFKPEDGIEVIASGKLTTYGARSKYQIVVDSFEIAGEGALLALLEKTRARLEAEGLFARERKQALPLLPRVIGVVTSPTGSVIRDILHRLADRFPVHVLVWPVVVQGSECAAQVAGAIRGFDALGPDDGVPRPDLVIVARGGGSIEDLWGFNEEAVVRAIADCTLPLISAVGHETDTTLADYAADMRAPTPTAAAELAVPVRTELALRIGELGNRQQRAALRPLALGRERLEARTNRMPKLAQLLQPHIQRLDDLAERLRRALGDRLASAREKMTHSVARFSPVLLQRRHGEAARRLEAARLDRALLTRPLAQRREKLAALARLAEQLHPEKPLERGYAIVRDSQGGALTSKREAQKHAALKVQFGDGVLDVANASGRGRRAAKPARQKQAPRDGQDDLFD